MSTNRKIAKASLILMGVSIAGNLLSMLKEMLAAKYFGITKSIDAFNSAVTIPNYLTGIVISVATMVFIPLFIKYKHEDSTKAASEMASILINYAFILLAASAFVIFFFTNPIVNLAYKGFDTETSTITVNLLRILCFTAILSGLISILTSILNSFEQFFWPSISQIFVTLSTMFFIVFYSQTMGVYVFAWGLLIGLVLQFSILVYSTKRLDFKYSFNFNLMHPGIIQTGKMALMFLVLSFIGGLNPFINRAMASWLPEGSIASLAYAEKILMIPATIVSSSLAVAIFPFFSMQAAENKIDEMRHTLSSSIKMSGFIYVPLAVIMIIFAQPAVRALFQRGAFDVNATKLTATLLMLMSLQLFFSYSCSIMQRLIFVFQNMKVIVSMVLFGIVLNIVLNFIFIKTMNPPSAGIALSSSVGTFITMLVYFAILKRRIGNINGLSILRSLSSYLALSLIAAVPMYFFFNFLNNAIYYSTVNQFFKISISVLLGAAVYIALANYFKIEEFQKTYELTKIKLREFKQNYVQGLKQ